MRFSSIHDNELFECGLHCDTDIALHRLFLYVFLHSIIVVIIMASQTYNLQFPFKNIFIVE